MKTDFINNLADFEFDISDIVLVHRYQFFSKRPGLDCRKYGRSNYGMVLCVSGIGQYTYTGQTICLYPGEMMFLSKDSHYVVSCKSEEPFVHYTVNFNLAEFSFESQLCGVKTSGTESLFDKLNSIWQKKEYAYRVICKSILYQILYTHLRQLYKTHRNQTSYKQILPAVQFLEKNFTQNTNIAELAALCKMSETHFRRLWQELTGTSPVKYRSHKRVLLAKDLLLSGVYSIQQVSQKCGYDDANYFTRVFHSETGIPPREFQKGECF